VERAACAHCPITAAISAGGVACFTAVNHFVVQTISFLRTQLKKLLIEYFTILI